MASKRALVILAEGAEEMETVISVDVMRRAKIDVTLAGLDGNDPVKCSRGVLIKPDDSLENAKNQGLYDVVVLPGGLGGAERLGKAALSPRDLQLINCTVYVSLAVKDVLSEHEKNGKFVAAICAGPTAFIKHNIGKGKKLTSYPGVKDGFTDYDYQEERVVRDNTLITSRSPGTAMEFAVELVRAVQGDEAANALPTQMLMK